MYAPYRTCDVRHIAGSDAERRCPVHGSRQAASALVAPPALGEAIRNFGPDTGESRRATVPGYGPSVLVFDFAGGGAAWVDESGANLHRINGPARISQDERFDNRKGQWVSVASPDWAIDGREASMGEVYGRYMEAMSDNVIPSTDQTMLRDMLRSGALLSDERSGTITIGRRDRFDAYVDEYQRRYRRPDPDSAQRIDMMLASGGDWSEEWDVEYRDSQWQRHRLFGKAIPVDNSEISQWWWQGEAVGFNRYVGLCLEAASGGAISSTNAAAVEFVASGSEADPGGGLVLKAYRHHPWSTLVEAIAAKFPNPDPGVQTKSRHYAQPGVAGDTYWTVDGKAHRTDGPAVVSATGGPDRWAIDGKAVPRSHVICALVRERTGVDIDPRNTSALEVLEAACPIRDGDQTNDWTLIVPEGLHAAAELAMLTSPNP